MSAAQCCLRACAPSLSASCEICRAILAERLTLWPEFKVATALDDISVIIKHKTEGSRGRKDTVRW